jgi:hypothetical protein
MCKEETWVGVYIGPTLQYYQFGRVILEGSRFNIIVGKRFTQPHINQWLDMVVSCCHSNYRSKYK